MKILEIMPDFNLAGAEIMVENLTYYLKDKCTVRVVSMYDCDTAITKRFKENGVDIVFLGKQKGFDYNVLKKLRKCISDFNPDIIHTHRYMLPYAVLAGGLVGNKKIFHTVHNVAEKEVPNKIQKFQKIAFKFSNVTPVAISPLIKESVIERYKISEDNIPMIYNGVCLNRYSRKESYETHRPFTCIHIGRFSEQKNHELMLKVLKKLTDGGEELRFVFLGEGELFEDIKKQSYDMGINKYIEFAGVTGDIQPYIDKADIFMLPSKWEGMPITLIEAMSIGMPIIASNVGGVPDMINNNVEGILIEPIEEQLVKAILNLKNNIEKRKQLGENANKRANKFSVRNMGEEYLKIFCTK